MLNRNTWLLLLFATSLVLCGILLTTLPLGVPGEWTWSRVEYSSTTEHTLSIVIALIGVAPLTAVAYFGRRRIQQAKPPETAAWLAALTAASFTLLWLLPEASPPGYQLSRGPFILFYPSASGYYTEAREHEDLAPFLENYEATMAQGDVLHVGTHPPGLFILSHTARRLCLSSPSLTRIIEATLPESAAGAFALIDENSQGGGLHFDRTDIAPIWLIALCTLAAASVTVTPLFLLIRQDHSPEVAWKAASFWPLFPALAIFFPKSDLLYPLIAATLAWLAVSAARHNSRLRALLTGVVLCLGMTLSLAFLPIAAALILYSLLQTRQSTAADHWKQWTLLVASTVAGFVLTLVAFGVVTDMNLANVWLHNFKNHAGFYEQFPRTYWKWLFVNPLELALAVGVPIVVLVLIGCKRHFRSAAAPRWIACVGVWGLLWLSGKNMGEAARLWILLTPGLLWLAADQFADAESKDPELAHRQWLKLFALQALTAILTAMSVSGFFHE